MGLDPWTFLLGALLLLVLPLPWLMASIFAAAFHELCHLGAVYALGGRVLRLTIGPTGAVMEGALEGRWREILAAAAGPVGSLLLLTLAPMAPRIAVCGLIQGLFNLLPLYPLDGGRILRLSVNGRALRVIEAVLGAAVCLILFRLCTGLGLLLAIHFIFRKKPCKSRKIRVQ